MKEGNRFTYDISISINGDSGRQIKKKIALKLREVNLSDKSIYFPPYLAGRSDLELNDPLYIYVDEFVKFRVTFYPNVFLGDPLIEKDDLLDYDYNGIKAWVTNFRQREGSLEITFELVIETLMLYGGSRSIIDYLIKDLEINLQSLCGNKVEISVKEKFTKIRTKGKRKFKIKNRYIKLLFTLGLFALSFAVVVRVDRDEQQISKQEIENIVKKTIDELDRSSKTPKDTINVE